MRSIIFVCLGLLFGACGGTRHYQYPWQSLPAAQQKVLGDYNCVEATELTKKAITWDNVIPPVVSEDGSGELALRVSPDEEMGAIMRFDKNGQKLQMWVFFENVAFDEEGVPIVSYNTLYELVFHPDAWDLSDSTKVQKLLELSDGVNFCYLSPVEDTNSQTGSSTEGMHNNITRENSPKFKYLRNKLSK